MRLAADFSQPALPDPWLKNAAEFHLALRLLASRLLVKQQCEEARVAVNTRRLAIAFKGEGPCESDSRSRCTRMSALERLRTRDVRWEERSKKRASNRRFERLEDSDA
jgi:hypothetical protein